MGDGPNAIHEQLVKGRAVLDRVEEITVTIIRLKGRTAARLAAAKRDLRDIEDEAYTSRKVQFEQYVTGREREAYASLTTGAQRQAVRESEQQDISAGAALEAVKTVRWGIDGYRRDADTRLRLMTYERQLER
jgi:hypothetical protein